MTSPWQVFIDDLHAVGERIEGEMNALRRENERLREHSVKLNSLGWRMALALGDVRPGEVAVEADPEEQLTRLINKLEQLNGSGKPGENS